MFLQERRGMLAKCSPRKLHGDENLGLYVACVPGWRRKPRFVHYLFAAILDRCVFLAVACILVSAVVHMACRRRARGEGSLHMMRLAAKGGLILVSRFGVHNSDDTDNSLNLELNKFTRIPVRATWVDGIGIQSEYAPLVSRILQPIAGRQ